MDINWPRDLSFAAKITVIRMKTLISGSTVAFDKFERASNRT